MGSEGNLVLGRAKEPDWDISEADRDSSRESSLRLPSMKWLGSLEHGEFKHCFGS